MKFQKIIEEVFMNNNKDNITEKRLQELIDRYKSASEHGRYIGSFDDKEESVDIQSALEELLTIRKRKE